VLTDPILLEAFLRVIRVLTLVTGSLVLIDSIGIILLPTENPPHKPKWAAISWCIVAGTSATTAAFLLLQGAVLVSELSPFGQRMSVFMMYGGLTVGFTLRAVSRAHRPLFTILAVLGMSVAMVVFSIWDLVR